MAAATVRGARRVRRAGQAGARGSAPAGPGSRSARTERRSGGANAGGGRAARGAGDTATRSGPVRSIRGRSVRARSRRGRPRRVRRTPRSVLRDLLRPRGLSILLLAILTVAAVLWYTPLLSVRTVEVAGVQELAEGDVLDAAGVTLGTPMLRLDTGTVHERIAGLPRVAEVTVGRSWPSTAVLTVVEREPVVLLRDSDGLWLTDRTGLAYATVDEPPAGLPELQVDSPGPHDPVTLAAVQVVDSLPAEVRSEVLSVSADSTRDIRLALSLGREVRWGEALDSERKGRVLAALLTQEGSVYDVAAPDLPTIS
ncbi:MULTISPECIES: cell division protein FtsQ/DivIB [Actinoalloteichus]|uniref:Cell division septal protein n=1 Tax=Actinoalloteichus fjordicus TaxID=1612552 RepID=A0AAC9LCV3_9PSEU|nr:MULTISPECIES: FtsQ-type POTRA domain-containing protein [Actinoalloteichus]APU13994.1 cell division septal protein [Actinoalloteichus fjordicus]APU19940.1 cell division septal protein [Actinoalloteichus sp. GBA129-24]